MAVKLFDLRRNQAVPDAAGLTYDPLLRDIDPVTGLEAAVAPDIIIPVPKAAASGGGAVTTAMATGNQTVTHNGGAPIVFDLLALRMHTIQRVIAALTGVAAAGNPNAASQALVGAGLGRYFQIADAGNNASIGDIYSDNADATRTYRVVATKVASDGGVCLVTTRIPGGAAETTAATGTLNRVSGSGSATIAWLTAVNMEKYADVQNALAIANGAGTGINPQLGQFSLGMPPTLVSGPRIAPNILIPVQKANPAAATNRSFIATAMGLGVLTVQTAEAAPVSHDVLTWNVHTLGRVIAALLGLTNDRRRYFTIANATNASLGAVYVDNAIATNFYTVIAAKVSGDGSTLLTTIRNAPPATVADSAIATGTLNLSSGTGDATIPWLAPGIRFEKYMDIQNAVSVPAGAGLTFNPGLVVNGVPVMPDIVIPIPKATGTVPFVATDLAGAVGTVNVSHNNVGAINHDILSLRLYSIFRV